MKNIEIAAIFYAMADILEMKGVQWKPNAYRKAARTIETLGEPIEDVYNKGGIKALEEIPGVGEALAKKIEEYILTGKVKEYEKMKSEMPKGLIEMIELPGLGPKKAFRLYKELKIDSIGKLKKAASEGKIARLEGFGEKSQENILKSIELNEKGKERLLLGVVLPIAKEIIQELKKANGVKRIEYAGSLRRMRETIGDIDILAEVEEDNNIMEIFTKMHNVIEVLAKGKKKSMVLIKEGDYQIQVDLRIIEQESFGAALQYFTGNKEHNIELRKIAIAKGYKLNEYGIFKGEERIAGRTEEEIYSKLGMSYIPPEMRENRGEIKLAINGKIPKLVELKDIKGDLHVHSKWSDGNASIMEMLEEANRLGYEYLCIADHSKSERIANGMDEKRIEEQMEEVKEIRKTAKQKNIKTFLLQGCEVSITPNGELDFSDDILKRLDIVSVSVHSRFKSSKEQMTRRIEKALENRYVKILNHPTGRLINEREPYQVDMERIIQVCRDRNIALEINAFPNRLDLNDTYASMARQEGVNLVIDTDSHSPSHLQYMFYGVAVARRAWCEKENILNAKSFNELRKYLNIKPK